MDINAVLDILSLMGLLFLVIASYGLMAILLMTVGVIVFYIVRSFIWKGSLK